MIDRMSVLVIAGTDSSGGAGLTRDLATLADHNVGGVSAITAVTAQSDQAVNAVHLVPPTIITEQINGALSHKNLKAIKIGMLGCADTVEAVATSLKDFKSIPIILDPVLASSSGAPLLDEAGRDALIKLLLPLTYLVTPNMSEAHILAQTANDQASRILELGPKAVLIKGGHGTDDQSIDHLVTQQGTTLQFETPRQNRTLRGTGCMLASAIAANLAKGHNIEHACKQAKDYITAQITAKGQPSGLFIQG